MRTGVLTLVAVALMISGAAHAQQDQSTVFDKVKWQHGPSMSSLGNIAEIHIPAGYVFATASDTRLLMEAMQNPPSGKELGFIAPAELDWFVVFEFEDVGYVRDDEKRSLDADAMLKSIRASTEAANKERRRRGWPGITILGWEQEPHYDEMTHNLEWAIRGQTDNDFVINYNTRLLGRGGVMRVTLVTDPSMHSPTLPKFKTMLSGFAFRQGHRYAEFRQGDKMAKYGLSALVVGGATAVAVKTGAFKWLWKVIVIAFLAVVAFLKTLFSGRKKPAVEPRHE